MTDSVPIAFQGDVMLLGWADTNSRGRTVTFQLGVDGESHPFAYSRTKQGKNSGQRYAMVLVEIGDDDTPVQKTPSQMAFLLCRDPYFQHYLNERSFVTVNSEETARQCICEGCGVSSRSQLDKDPAARSAWLTQFFNPFTAHQAAMQQKALK